MKFRLPKFKKKFLVDNIAKNDNSTVLTNSDVVTINRNNLFFLVACASLLLIMSVGATFAYLSAKVAGNAGDANIAVTTVNVGAVTVSYSGDNSIDLANQTVLQDSAGTDITKSIKFQVQASQLSGPVQISYQVQVIELENTFCQYAIGVRHCATSAETTTGGACLDNNGNVLNDYTTSATCSGNGTWTATSSVANEIKYTFQTCTNNTYNSCSNVTNHTNQPYPVASGTGTISLTSNTLSSASTIHYYKYTTVLKNLNTVQDYNQGKTLSGKVVVAVAPSNVSEVA